MAAFQDQGSSIIGRATVRLHSFIDWMAPSRVRILTNRNCFRRWRWVDARIEELRRGMSSSTGKSDMASLRGVQQGALEIEWPG